jgi:hypothetical protein
MQTTSTIMALLLAVAGGCSSRLGPPRCPPPASPLVDEPAKTLDIGCDVREGGVYRMEKQ